MRFIRDVNISITMFAYWIFKLQSIKKLDNMCLPAEAVLVPAFVSDQAHILNNCTCQKCPVTIQFVWCVDWYVPRQ